MRVILKIARFTLKDLLRNRWSIAYALFFLVVTEGLLRMVAEPSKVMLSLMNFTLFLVPLVCIIFGTMYFYDSREFFKLLLAQPVRRSSVYLGVWMGLSLSLSVGLGVGILLPSVMRGFTGALPLSNAMFLLWIGWCLTLAFVGLAFLVAVLLDDKGRGVALAIFCWLFLAVLYDGVVLFAANLLSEYPLEKPILGATLLNPIDLARILVLIRIDISALMGYTGAVFERFFGGNLGMVVATASLILWTVWPAVLGLRQFTRKDL